MQVTSETRARLKWHAGLHDLADTPNPSVASCTWPGNAHEGQLPDAVADFILTLEALNRELNGQIPSESPASAEFVFLDVVYAIQEVIRMLRQYAEFQEHGADAGSREAWLVETAWLAVLAGDIDDIHEHLEEEERARGK
jgi:hypothetical protein